MEQIDIILATYNGEIFLDELIISVINQDYRNWKLIISDDKSTDSTLAMLRKYEAMDDRIKIINIDRQGGALNNFKKAIEYSEANYVMFCDQDDIWLKNKISKLYKEIKNKEKDEGYRYPVIIFSDLKMINENNLILTDSYFKFNKINPKFNLDIRYVLWKCSAPGCVSIMNRALIKISQPIPSDISMHDHWHLINALVYGSAYFLDEPTILYRQHSNNVIGGLPKPFFYKFRNINLFVSQIKKAAFFSRSYTSYVKQMGSKNKTYYLHTFSLLDRLKFLYFNVKPFVNKNFIFFIFFSYFFLLNKFSYIDDENNKSPLI